ncbi:hypothetical protein GCM10017744_084240 [Streptomyces antimycoticus]|uniref:Uncharacterized protein n=1 Tax=Streptomyces antimycoticus TaxID=68175 RepID=A0A4D4K3G0_9ACTN|nr:hypothetical protein SANT12839_017110 [Streptomyces antimycoticus]
METSASTPTAPRDYPAVPFTLAGHSRRGALSSRSPASTQPPGRGEPGPTHDPVLRPVSMLLVDGGDGHGEGTVPAALDILTTTLTHAGRSYRVGGLSTVVTRRAVRGRGHGARLVAAAHRVVTTGSRATATVRPVSPTPPRTCPWAAAPPPSQGGAPFPPAREEPAR